MNEMQTMLADFARIFLADKHDAIDRSTITSAIRQFTDLVSAKYGREVTEQDIDSATRVLETWFVVEQGPTFELTDRKPAEWYVGLRQDPGKFMARYLLKLAEDRWPKASMDELKASSARVLALLDDPTQEGKWQRRGLVVGDVQSGKTAHYAGVINRAADAGYRVIVVLSGMHNLLRLQVQQRLDADFTGYDTRPDIGTGTCKRIGVGLIDHSLQVNTLTWAGLEDGDFRGNISRSVNIHLRDVPMLLVVKKNATILQNLNRWVMNQHEYRKLPLLVIDDEADQASVDTNDQEFIGDQFNEKDYQPTRINKEIRSLLISFDRSALVAYTATPFANILIHDERAAENYGKDLFPSTFIMSLSSPDDYFGAGAVFGTYDEGETENKGLDLVRYVDQFGEGWMNDGHDKTHKPLYQNKSRIPPSLENAIDSFLLSCAAKSSRGEHYAHNSMLVHVSRYLDVHDIVECQVNEYLNNLKAYIINNYGPILDRLQKLWKEDYAPTTDRIRQNKKFGRGIDIVDWSNVLKHLPDSAEKVEVILANGRAQDSFAYSTYPEGRSLIAIGGDKLSRGLTLEGLTVSYFLRASKQYDSLIQMGRWFGYKRGFADLCRLYTTEEMEDWFRHVATANKELRDQLLHMRIIGASPKEYGLRVAGHSILKVTAANKQRYALQRDISYAGEGKIQTVLFFNQPKLTSNFRLTDSFLVELGAGKVNPKRPMAESNAKPAQGIIWRKVDGTKVANYLQDMAFPPENNDIEGSAMASYIEAQIASYGELDSWTIFLATGSLMKVHLGGHQVACVERTPRKDRPSAERFVVRSILNPVDEGIDLNEDQYTEALRLTNAARELNKKGSSSRPSGPSIREGRDPTCGLLIIYPIALASEAEQKKLKYSEPMIGVVVSFPRSNTAQTRSYLVNPVGSRSQTE